MDNNSSSIPEMLWHCFGRGGVWRKQQLTAVGHYLYNKSWLIFLSTFVFLSFSSFEINLLEAVCLWQTQVRKSRDWYAHTCTYLPIIRLAVALQPLWENIQRCVGSQVFCYKAHVFSKHWGYGHRSNTRVKLLLWPWFDTKGHKQRRGLSKSCCSEGLTWHWRTKQYEEILKMHALWFNSTL